MNIKQIHQRSRTRSENGFKLSRRTLSNIFIALQVIIIRFWPNLQSSAGSALFLAHVYDDDDDSSSVVNC